MHFEGPRRPRALGVVAWILVVPWAAWAVLRTFGLEAGRLVPAITFTPYVALTAPVPLVVALLARRWAAAAVAAAAAGGPRPLRVLLGDFNATLDHRELRRILDA